MKFSIMFWNVWHSNQISGAEKYSRLTAELKRLVDTHQPDFVALCEVVRSPQDHLPPLVAYLQALGYTYYHNSNIEYLPGYWRTGVTLSSRFKINAKRRPVISENGYAANHGYPGLDKEAISCKITLPEGPAVNIIVVHPSATIDSLKQNRVGMRSLEKMIRSEAYRQNTVLVGDMNQWRLMPGAFKPKVRDVMHSRTGSLLNPTWHYNAHRFTPLRLNLDYVYWSKDSDFSFTDFAVLSNNASDHRALLASFTY
jgi:endonuclease/exonuclease/phosphatase family metal-dependent hydrolase